jgi:hypothetical protein
LIYIFFDLNWNSNAEKGAEMLKCKSETVEEIAAQWAAKLATVSSLLGRLEVLSSLRDPHTGRYVHYGMSISVGDRTHEVLLMSHKEIFVEWQAMDIREQMRDLKIFVSSLPFTSEFVKGMDRCAKSRMVLETWTELESYRNFVPLSVPKLERDLFFANMSSIIAVLKAQYTKHQHRVAGSAHTEDPGQ